MLLFRRDGEELDFLPGSEFLDNSLQRKIAPGESRGKIGRSLGRINCGERLRLVSDHGDNSPACLDEAAQIAQLLARHKRHVDSEREQVGCSHCRQGFREATEWTAGGRIVQEQFRIGWQP
jgi:hypothetical protein